VVDRLFAEPERAAPGPAGGSRRTAGHAFQVLTGDAELRTVVAAIARALAGNGLFAFETRNPLARGWDRQPLSGASPEIITIARKAR
jgi:hypothetical protein